ncbi:MAG: hypothetical protein M1827_007241 [Pycnora praestabilis]|nr:MAG: hypothetical protein M1827_007241 [Pycnora praestabilis]
MTLDPGEGQRPTSPVSSGRGSPVQRPFRANGNDGLYQKDKHYRRYAASVERALSLFDTALQEWADYISFLGRLMKALQSHPPNLSVVPYSAIVAKRLAQCLNPSLPSGVHQKALEVYEYVFSLLGRDALSRDLPLYLPGLSSTLSFASLSVRPFFLSLFESHLLKASLSSLRPALKAIILALLPGLEEEVSEDFERTLKVLEDFRQVISGCEHSESNGFNGLGEKYFWQCFFLASITCPSRRQGALAFLVRRLPRLGGQTAMIGSKVQNGEHRDNNHSIELCPAAEAVVLPEPGLLVRCFAAGLSDDQPLIQRGFLDLLVTHLPLHSGVLQVRVTPGDLELIVGAAVSVVARRDMSLNRRLWTWLLGPGLSSNIDTDNGPSSPIAVPQGETLTRDQGLGMAGAQYFREYGLQPLVRSICNAINREHQSPTDRARPFRVCLSLMDRWEIGGLVISEVFMPIIDSVRAFQAVAHSREEFSGVLRSANVFFNGVESGLIWGELLVLLMSALGKETLSEEGRLDKLDLAEFIITNFNIREEEMLVIHMPMVVLALLTMIAEINAKSEYPPHLFPELSHQLINHAVSIADRLIEMVPERAYLMAPAEQASTELENPTLTAPPSGEVLRTIHKFYFQDQGNLEINGQPFSVYDIGGLLLQKLANLVSRQLRFPGPHSILENTTRSLLALLIKMPRSSVLHETDLLSALRDCLITTTLPPSNTMSFQTFSTIVSMITSLHNSKTLSGKYMSNEQVSELIPPLVTQAWSHLSPSRPKYHVEAVRCLWQLQFATSCLRQVEALLASLMIGEDTSNQSTNLDADSGKRFALVWNHTIHANGGHVEKRRESLNMLSTSSNRETALAGFKDVEAMLARPLFLLLDSLTDEGTELFMFTRNWLQNLPSIDRVFDFLINRLLTFKLLPTAAVRESSTRNGDLTPSISEDLGECLYFTRTLSNILRWSSHNIWFSLANDTVPAPIIAQASATEFNEPGKGQSFQEFFARFCMRALDEGCPSAQLAVPTAVPKIQRTVLSILQQILSSPYSGPLKDLELEYPLIDKLLSSLNGPDPFVQVALLDVIYATLKLRLLKVPLPGTQSHQRAGSRDTARDPSRVSLTTDHSEKDKTLLGPIPPPPQLVNCLIAALSSPGSRTVLDSWISFFTECLPLYSDTVFQVLIPLVECLCTQINQTFEELKATFRESNVSNAIAPESTLIALLNGLEQILARAHDRLLTDEMKSMTVRSPEQAQGFFGNMVAGVFTSETHQSRSTTANNRLTVLLSFQDTVRICFAIWSWGGYGSDISQDPTSLASFSYTSLRMRNRVRRILEHLFAAEALECLETVAEIWHSTFNDVRKKKADLVFNLLHVLDGSRPKNTIPAIFNAIYSRTNPSVLEPVRKSTLTSDLTETDIVAFLVDYARSLEDDAMDEIWLDCMTFLRDILANPFPHRQILPRLLEFTAILGEKVDNTNFGEQRKMRRELGDLFLRLLTGTFTTRPMAFSQDTVHQGSLEKASGERENLVNNSELQHEIRPDDVVTILASIVPVLPKILVEPDRVMQAAAAISINVLGPTFRSKTFPQNVTKTTLDLLYQIARITSAAKFWRKDVAEAFNDSKFFSSPVNLVEMKWLPVLRQWTLIDKDRMPDILSRLSAPTTAGIMFGVGASSARLEADRKTQLNLRRTAVLILAAADDNAVAILPVLEEKLVELLTATAASSPSSITRAEVYMVISALILKTSALHLAPLWAVINSELRNAISSVLPDYRSDTYNSYSLLQACRLLDILLTIAPDDFQLHEWLFITDTIDAVDRPSDWSASALIDEVSEELGSSMGPPSPHFNPTDTTKSTGGRRRPLLGLTNTKGVHRDDILGKVLKPFFSQLSIYAFESTYSLSKPDWQACMDGLLADLFDEATFVG